MLYSLLNPESYKYIAFAGLLLAFLLTCILLKVMQNILPRDGGRAHAVNAEVAKGKPRGAGIIFILVFIACSLIFAPFSTELLIYDIMLGAAMLSGYLDDSSKAPWGELKKGIIDLIISLVCAITYVNFNSSVLNLLIFDTTIELPPVVFVILATILIWVSINVTNCTDGVDGLSGCLSIITLTSFYFVFDSLYISDGYAQCILIMIICILGYLWFNASPSKLLMGDAGSRAIGLFIAVTALKSGNPLLFIPFAAVFILDGGLGLVKVSLLRFLKIKILKNTRTPLHDHSRKNKGWSDTQTVFRFTIFQVILSFFTIYLIL